MQMCVLLSLRTLILPPWGSGRVSGRRGYSGSFIITNDWRRSLPPSPLRGPLPPSGGEHPLTLRVPSPYGGELVPRRAQRFSPWGEYGEAGREV